MALPPTQQNSRTHLLDVVVVALFVLHQKIQGFGQSYSCGEYDIDYVKIDNKNT